MGAKVRGKRRRTPTILQMEAVECGAAALAMVLAAHGRWVPLEELRQECGVSRDGSRAANILRAARRYGLEAKGKRLKGDLDELVAKLLELELPAILHWNMNHFVVLEGIQGKTVYLNDPAAGPRKITLEELDGSFSGVAMYFQPKRDGGPDDFVPGGQKRSVIGALRRRLEGSELALTFAVLCGLFLVVPGLVVPAFARIFVDELLVGGHRSLLKPLLIGMTVTALVRAGLTWLQESYLLRLETKVALATSARFFRHVLRLPVGYFSQRFAGEIGSRVLINDKVARILSGRLATTVIDTAMIVFYGGLMFLYDVSLTLIIVALGLLNVVVVQLAARRRIDAARRLLLDQGKLTGTAMNGLAMIETLKATGSEGEFFGRWSGYQAKMLKSEQELAKTTQMVSAMPPLVNTLTTCAVLYFGGREVIAGQMTIGMLVAYQTLAASFTKPLNTLVTFGSSLQELEADMNRLDDVLQHPTDPRYEHGTSVPDSASQVAQVRRQIKLSGAITLRNISFRYSPRSSMLIEDFDLDVQPGQRVALVGGSGSGKSTIARLIAGLYEPEVGEVLFDGVPRRQLPSELISNSLAVVDQDIFLFAGTIRDNISLWDPSLVVSQMTAAARDAEIDDVIENRDGAYLSPVAEQGRNFSGGQKQRLEIARALAANPTMLILDEATSALDPTTELAIDDHLRRRGCTCIIVAHRLSTIRDADEIVVLDRGKIEARGAHDELLESSKVYAELIES